MEVPPSPKLQFQAVGEPLDLSTKFTAWPVEILVDEALNCATTEQVGADTVIVAFAVSLQVLPDAISVTVYVPAAL